MPIPDIKTLEIPTLECLKRGITNSDQMREHLAKRFRLTKADWAIKLESQTPVFTNNHAWALVRLGQRGLIQKMRTKTYKLTREGERFL
jgi:hypothetical protein